MDSKSYQVIIYAEHCEDAPAVIARRLARFSGQPESLFSEGLLTGLVIFARGLSYADAVAYKEKLEDEGIFAEIRRSESEILGKYSLETLENKQITSFRDDADVLLTEFNDDDDLNEKGQLKGGWDVLFPDLAENLESPPYPPVKKPVLVPPASARAESGPAISSWQPALDTQEGVVASVPVKAIQKPRASHVNRPAEKLSISETSGERSDDIENIKRSREFAGTVLSEAVVNRGETLGPYAPTGFDPRPAHVPVVAAIFSGFAPGAGQIYNGQDDAALKYGMWFWWIRPWIASVRQAYEYGIRVRDYYEPQPADASFGRALRYVAGWYLVVFVLVGLIVFGASAIWENRTKQEQVVMQIEIADVVERAVHDIQFARMSANTAVNRFLDEQNKSKQQFTMSAEERAHRLYVIGYSYCVGRQYNLCEATMRRVTSLGARNRDAYRLQTWASMQIKEGGKTPMPEIGEVPTLFELELHQENDPDRDIVQPALNLMRNEQGANNATKE